MKKFCILTTQRSGSTWVMDSIQRSFKSSIVFGELFLDRPARSKDPWSEPHGNLVPIVRYHDWRKESGAFFLTAPKLYLSFLELYAQHEPIFGFKIMYNQFIRKPCLAMLLKQRNYSVLHLKRDNLLDVYISSQNIHKLKPHLRVDDPDATKGYDPITLEPQKVYLYIKKLIFIERIVKSIIKLFNIKMEEVEYGLLSSNDKDEIEKLNKFIGQSINLFSSEGLQKLSGKNTYEKITNYEEVIGYLTKRKLNKSYYIEKKETQIVFEL